MISGGYVAFIGVNNTFWGCGSRAKEIVRGVNNTINASNVYIYCTDSECTG